MAYPNKVGAIGIIVDESGHNLTYPLRNRERVRVTAISPSGRLATVKSMERPWQIKKWPIAGIKLFSATRFRGKHRA